MIFSSFSHFCFGLVACFLGGLPLGLINMSVVNITINKSIRSAYYFALGSSTIEILEASVAIVFGLAIEGYLRQNEVIQLLIFAAFVILGIYFFAKKDKPIYYEEASTRKSGAFIKGIAVAILNPQAIPFWLFALAFIAPYNLVNFIGSNLFFFLGGVFLGKLMSLLLFVKGAKYIKAHLNESSRILNRTMGSIFIIIGIAEAIRYLL